MPYRAPLGFVALRIGPYRYAVDIDQFKRLLRSTITVSTVSQSDEAEAKNIIHWIDDCEQFTDEESSRG